MLAQIGLKIGVAGDVGAVIQDQIELDLDRVRALQKMLVEQPIVRCNSADGCTVLMLEADRFGGKGCAANLAIRWARIAPVSLPRTPLRAD